MQDCDPAEVCRQCLAADTAPIFSKNNVEAFVFVINTCISQNLSQWDRSKPRVVEADLRLLEMQIARAGGAHGSVEMSQEKVSVPVALSGHGPRGVLAWQEVLWAQQKANLQ